MLFIEDPPAYTSAQGSKKCPQARSGGSVTGFEAYFGKELLLGIIV